MASRELLSPELRRHAKGMDARLVERLSQAELNLRMAEVARIYANAEGLPGELYRGRVAKAFAIRDAIPYPEYQERLDRLHAYLDRLPGTGRTALSARESTWAVIRGLKKDNCYPDGIGQTAMTPVMAVAGGK